jgi:hypothetical protein
MDHFLRSNERVAHECSGPVSKRLLIAVILFFALVELSGRAMAGSPPGCARGLLGTGVRCKGGTTSGGGGGGPGHPTTPPPGSGPGTTVDPKDVIDVAEASSHNGAKCYILVAVDTTGLAVGEVATLMEASNAVVAIMPACPNQPVDGVPIQPTPAQLATTFWDTIRLPVPKPRTQPDFAITGKLTYLSAGDTNTPPTWTRATPFGPLTIKAHGTYTVEWGDHTPPTGPYTNPGGPYPSGTITHTYDNTGTVTITVRENWTATWSVGGYHGTLVALHTVGTDPGFMVRQIQAVITQSA